MNSIQMNEQDADKEGYGSQLSLARLRQGLTVQQVAEQLNLPAERIDEIESGEFNMAIGPMFYRGYIRSYSQLMKLNESEVLAGYNGSLADSVELKSLGTIGGVEAVSRREVNTRSSIFKWITGVIVIGILAAAIWGIKERFIDGQGSSDVISGEMSAELFVESVDNDPAGARETLAQSKLSTELNVTSTEARQAELSTVALNELASSSNTATAKGTSKTDSESQSSNQSEASDLAETSSNLNALSASSDINDVSTQKAGAVNTNDSKESLNVANLERLEFVFLGDCWVEVIDARGEQLAIGIKKDGRVMSVDGVAPFSILLGDASVVRLKQGEQSIDLSRYRPGQTARLTLR